MAPFPPWSNTLVSVTLVFLVLCFIGAPLLFWLYVRTPFNTRVGDPVLQPVMFDHRHHVGDDGIDCRYCHYTVERSPYASVPSAALCMGCHGQIWSSARALEPIRAAYFNDKTLIWQRVHSVPDFVFFNHAIHTMRGVGCVTCHGRVDLQAAVAKGTPMTMGFCLDCHRDPEPHLRPRQHITDMTWSADNPRAVGAAVRVALGINPPTTCSGCHR
jgi:hypothetical protein